VYASVLKMIKIKPGTYIGNSSAPFISEDWLYRIFLELEFPNRMKGRGNCDNRKFCFAWSLGIVGVR
jgi:hypothetical protein